MSNNKHGFCGYLAKTVDMMRTLEVQLILTHRFTIYCTEY